MTRDLLPLLLLLTLGCGGRLVRPSATTSLPLARVEPIDISPKLAPVLLAQESYLRAYLFWFGGLAPLEVQARAHNGGLFDLWSDYLASLGLPDYRVDQPRAVQSNALMMSTLARLAEALCVRAAEHDFRGHIPATQRIVFPFDATSAPSRAEFELRFDALHRLFLSYPAALARPNRIDRFYQLYRATAARHLLTKGSLSPDEAAWASVCAALAQHPEARLR